MGISQANQNSDKFSIAASCDMSQKASRLKGLYSYGGSSCMPLRKPASSVPFFSLKFLYTDACSMRNKQEELELCMQW